MADVAKLFWAGHSQAIRLPVAYQFEGEEVRIRREGSRVILSPADVDYTAEDIALDTSRGIEEMRALIAQGEDDSEDAPLDMQRIIDDARRRHQAGRG